MMNKFILTCILMFAYALSFSQNNFRHTRLEPLYPSYEKSTEIGVNAGLTAFLGDLGGTRGEGKPFSKDLNGITFRPHLGLSYGYYPASWLKVMATANFTTITGGDSVIKTKVNQSFGRYERNLSFRSRLQEFAISGELYPLQLISKTHRETLLKPFVGVGVGVFHYNPKAKLNGDWIALKPLRLEGEGFSEYPNSKQYKLTQFYIPFTFGFKYRLSEETTLAFSATFRKTFTDYLDDVSQNYIDPNLFDKYLSANDANLAKQLYYRGLKNTQPKPGSQRSYSNKKDSYTTLFITYSYNFGYHPKDEVSDKVIKVKRFRRKR